MILVTGATGFIGRHLVRQLLDNQLPVRCLLPEDRLDNLPWDTHSDHTPEIITGNVLDEEAVFQAVTGAHTIFHLENAMWWGNERNLERIEVAGTRNLITAARSARVGRLMYLSHLGASASSAYTLHRIKGQVENLVQNSGLAYTIIRSGIVFGEDDAFFNHIAMMLQSNPILHLMPGEGEIVLHPIYIDDLIKALLLSMEDLNLIDRTIEIGGLEYITYEDLLLTIMRVTNSRRLIIALPPYLMRAITGISQRIFPRTLMSPQWLDILAVSRTTHLGNTFQYFDFSPRRIEDTLLTYMPEQNYLKRLAVYPFRRRPRGI